MMRKEMAIIGAGKIGRGVVGMLFSLGGWKLHLYDSYAEGMCALARQGHYDVRITDGRSVDETVRVGDFDIVDGSDTSGIANLLSSIDLVACCVYEGAFQSVARVIAEAVRLRVASDRVEPLNVLLCVNALGAPDRVASLVEDEFGGYDEALSYLRERVGICQVMVLAAGMPSEPGANPWQVVVSADPGLEVDADAWRGERVEVPHVSYVSGAQAHLYRKVYCGNMRHAMAGFMGRRRGLKYICECNQDPWIRKNIVRAFGEAHEAICAEYAFDQAEDAEWVAFLDAKLDADTKDPVERVIDRADEKLSRNNRFVGPALLCAHHEILPFYLTRGAAYGLRCLAEAEGRDPKAEREVRAYVSETCGLTEGDGPVLGLIASHYLDILDGESQGAWCAPDSHQRKD